MLQELKNGLYVSAIGWTDSVTHAPVSAPSSAWSKLELTVAFDAQGHPTQRNAVDLISRYRPLPNEFLKSSGVARARSAAKSTIFAAVLGRELAAYLKRVGASDGNRVSLGAITSSAVVPVVWQFESVGLTDSWENANTMLLPASIPSSMVTAISNVTDFHASAVNYAGGAAAVFEAIEHAYLDFFHDRADYSLIVCAEEICTPIVDCMKRLTIGRDPLEGASGFVLSRKKLNRMDWRIAFISRIDQDQKSELDPYWQGAEPFVVVIDDDCPTYTSTIVPQAMQLAMSPFKSRSILDVRLGRRLRYLMGLRQDADTAT